MASTSCNELARKLLEDCLDGVPWRRELLRDLVQDACSETLVRIVAEGLADRFEPALCDAYAELFSEAISCVLPELDAAALLDRYRRVRRARPPRNLARVLRVFVLSRVTLGADVAVTGVILDGAKRRFPGADIYLVGGQKSWELFAADPRIRQLPVAYHRGSLRERLTSWMELKQALAQPDSIVIDPDSRLTQLGLLPVCDEDNYCFFESRAYGGDGDDALPVLTSRWFAELFSIPDVKPYIAPAEHVPGHTGVAISLGVGENAAKRVADPFEEELLRHVSKFGMPVWIDKGAGGEEAARVERAIARSGAVARTWDGSFAGFASIIARSRLYIGYDSAGQHVAAACGVPLASIFAGFPCPRMFSRWRPSGPGRIEVIRVDDPDPAVVLAQTIRALDRLR